jgi:hypothetical protein
VNRAPELGQKVAEVGGRIRARGDRVEAEVEHESGVAAAASVTLMTVSPARQTAEIGVVSEVRPGREKVGHWF